MKTQIKYWRGINKTRGSGEPVSLKSNTGEELIKKNVHSKFSVHDAFLE